MNYLISFLTRAMFVCIGIGGSIIMRKSKNEIVRFLHTLPAFYAGMLCGYLLRLI